MRENVEPLGPLGKNAGNHGVFPEAQGAPLGPLAKFTEGRRNAEHAEDAEKMGGKKVADGKGTGIRSPESLTLLKSLRNSREFYVFFKKIMLIALRNPLAPHPRPLADWSQTPLTTNPSSE